MKKILLASIALMMLAVPASAQYYSNGRPIPPRHRTGYNTGRYSNSYGRYSNRYNYGNTYYGFRIGLGIGTVNSESDYLDGSDAKTGLNLGFVVGTQLVQSAPLFFETGLYYTEKGGESTYNGSKFKYGLDYLEVPLLLKYKYYAEPDFSVEPFIGGYLSCGVGGKIKNYKAREAYGSFDSDYDDNFNRFDGGLKLGCGVGFQMMYLEASYDIGLANVGKDDFDDTHTGCFNLTFGVNF
jgi:hypothetical protein